LHGAEVDRTPDARQQVLDGSRKELIQEPVVVGSSA
jgi:hypothetical protein